jgi:hypothetical protein
MTENTPAHQQAPAQPEGGKPWYQIASWSFYLTVLSASLLAFLYFHELGFFSRYVIPIEYIHIELFNSIQYMPAYILAVNLLFIVISISDGVYLDGSYVYRVKPYVINILFLFMIITLGLGLIVQKKLAFLIFLIPIAMEFFPKATSGYHELNRCKIRHAVSVAILVFTISCMISFWIGFFERLTIGNSYYFQKYGTGQMLLRHNDNYSIYIAPDTNNKSINGRLVIISKGNNNDTLVFTKE